MSSRTSTSSLSAGVRDGRVFVVVAVASHALAPVVSSAPGEFMAGLTQEQRKGRGG